jgi:hypothetical protein
MQFTLQCPAPAGVTGAAEAPGTSAPQRGRRAGSRLIALDGRSEDEQGAAAVCMAVWMGTSTRSRGETLRGI